MPVRDRRPPGRTTPDLTPVIRKLQQCVINALVEQLLYDTHLGHIHEQLQREGCAVLGYNDGSSLGNPEQ